MQSPPGSPLSSLSGFVSTMQKRVCALRRASDDSSRLRRLRLQLRAAASTQAEHPGNDSVCMARCPASPHTRKRHDRAHTELGGRAKRGLADCPGLASHGHGNAREAAPRGLVAYIERPPGRARVRASCCASRPTVRLRPLLVGRPLRADRARPVRPVHHRERHGVCDRNRLLVEKHRLVALCNFRNASFNGIAEAAAAMQIIVLWSSIVVDESERPSGFCHFLYNHRAF